MNKPNKFKGQEIIGKCDELRGRLFHMKQVVQYLDDNGFIFGDLALSSEVPLCLAWLPPEKTKDQKYACLSFLTNAVRAEIRFGNKKQAPYSQLFFDVSDKAPKRVYQYLMIELAGEAETVKSLFG